MYTSTWLKIVNRDLIHKGLQSVDTSGCLHLLDVEKVVVSICPESTQRGGAALPSYGKTIKHKHQSAASGKPATSSGVPTTNDPHSASLGGGSTTALTSALSMMALITGQRAYVTKAKKSIAAWQLRAGQPIGCKTTLRARPMWEYLDKTLKVALWRSPSYSGVVLPPLSGTKYSFTIGVPDINIYPETDTDLSYATTQTTAQPSEPHSSSLDNAAQRDNAQTRSPGEYACAVGERLRQVVTSLSPSSACPYSIGRLLANGGSKSAADSIMEEEMDAKRGHEFPKPRASLSASVLSVSRSAQVKKSDRRGVSLAGNTVPPLASAQRRKSGSALGLQFTMVIVTKPETLCRPQPKNSKARSRLLRAPRPVTEGDTDIKPSARLRLLTNRNQGRLRSASSLCSASIAVYLSGLDLLITP